MTFPSYRNLKPSGIEWLGEVPAHWTVARLRFHADLNPSKQEVAGLAPTTESTFLPMEAVGEDGTLCLDQTRPLGELLSGYTYFAEQDVAYAKITPCFENGKGALMQGLKEGFGFGTTELTVLRAKPSARPRFLWWLTQSAPFRKLGESAMYGAGGQQRVPDAFAKDFSPAWPPLDEQGAITAFLDRETAKIDTLISEQGGLVERLKEKRQAVASHLLTTGLDPNAARKPSGVVWFPETPSHWNLVRLKSLVVEGVAGPYGSSLTKSMYTDSGYRVYGQQQVIPDDFSIGDYYISESHFLDMQRYEVQSGDVLISVMGTVGKAACVPEGIEPGIINPRLVLYRVNSVHISPKYLAAFINSHPAQAYLSLVAQGSTMDGLNMRTIEELVVPVPPREEQQTLLLAIEKETTAIDRLLTEAKTSIALLQEHRAALITAVVTGKVDVRGDVA